MTKLTLRYRIHGGADEIGGNLIEVEYGGQRLILDMGLPLSLPEDGPFSARAIGRRSTADIVNAHYLPDLPGLYSGEDKSVLGIFVSHPHRDHFGFISRAGGNIPVYIGDKARILIEATSLFIPDYPRFEESRCRPLQDRVTINIGPFKVTPYRSDHSVADAFSLLVEAGGRTIFYSGDLRAHGRDQEPFQALLRDLPRNIDHFLLEGTMMGRSKDKPLREVDLANDFIREMTAAKGLVLVNTSSHNWDRLETLYHTAMSAGRTLVMDNFTAYLFRAAGHPLLPGAPGVRVFFPLSQAIAIKNEKSFAGKLDPFQGQRIYGTEIAANPGRFVMLFRGSMVRDFSDTSRRYIPLRALKDGVFIYSQWEGYWEDMTAVHRFLADHSLRDIHIHCSGHAYRKDLGRLLNTARPRFAIPIHTEAKLRNGFKRLYGSVLLVKKGEWQDIE